MADYSFSAAELESQIPTFAQKGITEFSVHDPAVAKDKRRVLKIINLIEKHAPGVFVSILAEAGVIDREVIAAASQIFCSFDIPLEGSQKGGALLFDKKFYASKARLLNDAGLVFGFQLTYAVMPGDSLKLFMERLDFAVNQYPNHIDFAQLEKKAADAKDSVPGMPTPTGLYSAHDIRYSRDIAFACQTFYSAGRAVPWFLSVLKPLRIYPSRLFADFAEWQCCNNCDYKSGFDPLIEPHKSIEKMQLLFLDEKYEEKKCRSLETLVHDIVKINGAMSRLAGENEESIVETAYNPEDLLGPESLDLTAFAENVCMEHCRVKIFAGEEGPDYSVL